MLHTESNYEKNKIKIIRQIQVEGYVTEQLTWILQKCEGDV